MIKKILLFSLAPLFSLSAHAQLRYNFKDTTTAYVPLTNAISLNGSLIWDEENLVAPMPFTWEIDSSISVNKFYLSLALPGIVDDTLNPSDLSGFILGDMDISDRGALTNIASMSPIRYATTGATPNRIFKMELANAGFYEENDLYSSNNDSFALQIWVYETRNIVELHYGPSRITHPSDYFFFGSGGPYVAYAKHCDFNSGSTGVLYNLSGIPSSPTIDSAVLPDFPTSALTAWPASGRVYRFTPKWLSCPIPASNYTSGTPSGNTIQYTYTGTTPVDSVRWYFGDGNSSTAMNPSHTFPNNGHYNVCVTAYNSCGSNTYCKQLSLAVNKLAALGNVQVYPNPASNSLTIEGMLTGGKAVLQSVTGRQVISCDINITKQTLDLSALPAGTYMLMLSNPDGARGTIPVIKQ